MREVFEQYGKCILEAVVCITLLGIIFTGVTDEHGNRGLYAIIGSQIDAKGMDYKAYTDFREVYRVESEKDPPFIYFEGSRLEVGEHILSNYIKAVDYSGKVLEIRIQSILNPNGVEKIGAYHPETGKIHLSEAGVYVVRVLTFDDGNRSTEVSISIPINQKKRWL